MRRSAPTGSWRVAFVQHGASEAIQEAMATLTPREREVVEMTLAGDLMQTEIANALGLTRQAISLAMKRAFDKLRTALEGDERVVEVLGLGCD
ncbi:MAG: sigma factor-like helix-turn-helix DNA-binding protein [Dehalococcoidia bacterium]